MCKQSTTSRCISDFTESGENRGLSPVTVRSKGRSPFKRKVSKVDETVRKKKEGMHKPQ